MDAIRRAIDAIAQRYRRESATTGYTGGRDRGAREDREETLVDHVYVVMCLWEKLGGGIAQAIVLHVR